MPTDHAGVRSWYVRSGTGVATDAVVSEVVEDDVSAGSCAALGIGESVKDIS